MSQLTPIIFRNIQKTGWNEFYSYANIQVDMIQQYRAVGFLQGYITYQQIYSAFVNFYKSVVLNGNPEVNEEVKQFINNQFNWLDEMCQKNQNDLFWQQVNALLEQLRFMYKGYITRINQLQKPDLNISFSQFYYLTNTGDLEDLLPAFSGIKLNIQKKNCATLIKNIQGDLYVAQNTHNIYNFMLRIHKSYHFPSKNPQIASQWITFSSRPGDLESKDDFYILSSGLIVTQTSLANHNDQNWKKIHWDSIPTWLRHNVANRLAKTNSEWAEYFGKFRSYTHNNQWIIIDFNKFLIEKNPQIHLVEQGFEVYAVTNFTERFYEKGFIAGYNIPYNQQVYDTLKTQVQGYNYQNTPRAIQYSKYADLSDDQATFKTLLRTNNNVNPTEGNAPRYDVTNNPTIFGQIDQKIVNSQVFKSNKFSAISGPPTSNGRFAPFDWKDFQNESHMGMPDVWDFDWVELVIDYQLQQKRKYIDE